MGRSWNRAAHGGGAAWLIIGNAVAQPNTWTMATRTPIGSFPRKCKVRLSPKSEAA